MTNPGLLYPHNIVIALFGSLAFILNALNVVCSATGKKLNAVDIIQILKSALSLAALVISIPMAATGFDKDAASVLIFDAINDVLDVLLIHSLPLAFLVMAVVRLRISQSVLLARDLITRRWGILVLTLCLLINTTMAVLRVPVVIYDIQTINNQFKKNASEDLLQDPSTQYWQVVFKVCRMCILDVLPSLAGITIYGIIYRHLSTQDIKSRWKVNKKVNHSSQIFRKPATARRSESSFPKQASTETATSTSTFDNIRSPAEAIRASVAVLITSHVTSWVLLLTLESLTLADVELPLGYVLYGKTVVLTLNPIGDGLFLKTKRKRLADVLRQMTLCNKVHTEGGNLNLPLPLTYWKNDEEPEHLPYTTELPALIEDTNDESFPSDVISVLVHTTNALPTIQEAAAFDNGNNDITFDSGMFPHQQMSTVNGSVNLEEFDTSDLVSVLEETPVGGKQTSVETASVNNHCFGMRLESVSSGSYVSRRGSQGPYQIMSSVPIYPGRGSLNPVSISNETFAPNVYVTYSTSPTMLRLSPKNSTTVTPSMNSMSSTMRRLSASEFFPGQGLSSCVQRIRSRGSTGSVGKKALVEMYLSGDCSLSNRLHALKSPIQLTSSSSDSAYLPGTGSMLSSVSLPGRGSQSSYNSVFSARRSPRASATSNYRKGSGASCLSAPMSITIRSDQPQSSTRSSIATQTEESSSFLPPHSCSSEKDGQHGNNTPLAVAGDLRISDEDECSTFSVISEYF